MDRCSAKLDRDDQIGVSSLLESICDSSLAQRIEEAALMAAAYHMLHNAQKMQSAVEAEHSAQ